MNFERNDYFPNGKLCLRVLHAPHHYRKRKWWRDEGDRGLDEQLGRAVAAIEDIVHLTAIEDLEEREREKQRLTAERKRLRDERLRWYRMWLVEDLDRMVLNWERAQRIRTFLAEYERRLPDETSGERSTAWRQAVAAHAAALDPMNQADRIAKETSSRLSRKGSVDMSETLAENESHDQDSKRP